MSAIYDRWERLVAAVLPPWHLCHAESTSASISSSSSGFSFCRLTSSLDDVPFSFSSPEWFASNHKDDGFGSETAAATHSSILVEDQFPAENISPKKNVTFTPPKKRDLKIQVPILQIEDRGFSRTTESSRSDPRAGGRHTDESQTKWHHDAKRTSYPLPLPPAAISSASQVSRPNSAAKSPSRSPERAENAKSPWKKGKWLGRGPSGDVYLGFNSEKGRMCAMKEVSLSSDDTKVKQNARMLEKEIALLSHMKHPNLVQYYGSEMVNDSFYIYYEFVSGGSIYMILQEYGRLGESAIRNYTQQILLGLAYLHSKSIAHRDIKGATILVEPDGRVKLCNFGVEKHIAEQYRTSWLMDSPYWLAPEVIMNSNERNLAVDIWSLGCTVLEMATSKPPLSQYDTVMAMYKVAYQNELPTIPEHLSDVCKDFLRHCLQRNPLHRATASQLLDHPFVKNSSPLGKQIMFSTSSGHPAATSSVSSEGFDNARSPHHLDSGKVSIGSSKASKSNSQTSDIYNPRNISAPVSPAGSPLPHPRSPQHPNRQMSPPTKSSPCTAGSPLPHPIIRGIGGTPCPHINQSMSQQENFHNLPKHSSNISSPSYWDPNILRGPFRLS